MKRLLALLLAGLLASSLQAQTLRIITEQWPPFNFQENGESKGLAVEMVQALLKDSGSPTTITFLPWNRAYAEALKDPNVILFTLGRNAEREPLFDWIFKVAERENWLFRLSSRSDIHLSSLNDARNLKIGTGAIEDASTRDLVHEGFIVGQNLDSEQSADPDLMNLQKLQLGRVDLIVANPISLAYTARNLNISMKTLQPALRVGHDSPGHWVALSRGSDPALLKKLNASARKLEKQGVFKALIEKYAR